MSAPGLIRSQQRAADLLLRDVRVLDPRERLDARLDVLVRAGTIAELAAPRTLAPTDDVEVIDGEGRLSALPAFFDPHVHLRTPGQEHKEDIASGTRAAAAGGFGAVIAMPNTDPALDTPERLRAVQETARRDAHISVGFLAAVTHDLQGERLTAMAELAALGALGFTDDGLPVANAAVLRAALSSGAVLALHEEDRALSAGGVIHEGHLSAELGLPGVPCASEATMVARDAALAACEGGRVHFQHLSCRASVQALAAAKACGARVSAEATPHHLLLTEEDVRGLDPSMKMNPPLATEADRRALIDALRDGTIDCVATDHAPHAPAEKAVGFADAPMGTTGLETAFAALYTELVLPGVLGLDVLAERMTAGAALFGLPLPLIATGEQADIALIDLDAEWVAGEHGWQSRSENCCFAGERLRGRVLLTLAAGAIAFRAAGTGAVGGAGGAAGTGAAAGVEGAEGVGGAGDTAGGAARTVRA
jgi:dihydroorotase